MKDSTALRPIDLARVAGLSPQSVRNYERWGFLPPAGRGPGGHRRYGPRHLQAVQAARRGDAARVGKAGPLSFWLGVVGASVRLG